MTRNYWKSFFYIIVGLLLLQVRANVPQEEGTNNSTSSFMEFLSSLFPNAKNDSELDFFSRSALQMKKSVKGILSGIAKLFDPLREQIENKLLKPVPLGRITFAVVNPIDRDLVPISPLAPTACDDPAGKIYIITHGWLESRKENWIKNLTIALLVRDQHGCVMQVDWNDPAAETYLSAVFYTESVGEHIANIIIKLNVERQVLLERFVIIGHSLGAQVAGWAGKKIIQKTHAKIGRIIALDPAGPVFDIRDDSLRLNRNDALVVEVLHTDAGKLGADGSCGTIDFYANGGSEQPGCEVSVNIGNILERIHDMPTCAHARSWKIFIEALRNPHGFFAKKCTNWQEYLLDRCEPIVASLGDLTTTKKGDFFFATNAEPPFAKIKAAENLKMSDNDNDF